MNAITFLVNEHNKVRKMIARIEDDSKGYPARRKLFNELCRMLVRHEKMEQKIWYPYLKKHEEEKPVKAPIKHLLTEEKDAKKAIDKFKKIKTQETWEKKFKKFKHAVEHHASEEEDELFPRVKKNLTLTELNQIGKKMKAFMHKK